MKKLLQFEIEQVAGGDVLPPPDSTPQLPSPSVPTPGLPPGMPNNHQAV